MKTIDQSISVIPIPTLTLQSEATELAMAVEASTEYIDLPEALAHRLEGSVL